MKAALVDELKRQAAAHPGFSTETTADRGLFVVRGILDVDALAAAAADASDDDGDIYGSVVSDHPLGFLPD